MDDVIRALLADDETMADLLTGGFYAGGEISRQLTPEAFDVSGEILPCVLVKHESEAAAGIHAAAGNLFVVLYFYQRSSVDVIRQAAARAFALLHQTNLGRSTVWDCSWINDVTDQEDPGLGCRLELSRYQIVRRKN
jgi:hypothetical protein